MVIPVRNGEAFIGDAVASVLGQTYARLECIVVNDGSTDGTGQVLSDMADSRLTVVDRTGSGSVSAARNAGCDHSTGDLIAFLDADDVWHPDKLARQIALFRRRPNLGIAWCGYVITEPDLEPISEIRPQRRYMDLQSCVLLEGNGILLSSTGIVSRGALESVGGFDESLSVSADLDFAERVVRHNPSDLIDDVLVAYRKHRGQMHLDLAGFEHDMRRVLESRGLPPKILRRGQANLATRLFYYNLRRDRRKALGHLRQLGRRLDRPVLLPLEGIGRRVIRRIRRARAGVSDPRMWTTTR